MKLSGDYTNAEIMEIHQIKNRGQIKTWVKWHREGQTHRLAQPLGKQYSYDAELSEIDELKKKVLYYEANDYGHKFLPDLPSYLPSSAICFTTICQTLYKNNYKALQTKSYKSAGLSLYLSFCALGTEFLSLS